MLIYDPVYDKPLLSGRPRNGGSTVVHNAAAALIDYFVDWYLNWQNNKAFELFSERACRIRDF